MFGPTKAKRLGVLTLSGGQLKTGDNNLTDIMRQLPVRNDPGGVGYLRRLVLQWDVTFGTLANDPTIPSYMLDALVTEGKLIAVDGTEFVSRLGYHQPIREYDKTGWLRSTPVAPDIAATGAGGPGSYVRTITRVIDFYEPAFSAAPWFRMLPNAYFQGGTLYCNLRTGPVYLNGATVTVTAAQLTVTAYTDDWYALQNCPIGLYVKEGYLQNDTLDHPTPKAGAYLRWYIAKPAEGSGAVASATPGDNLSAITRLTVGPREGAKLYADRYIADLIARYMQSSRDEQKAFTATGLVYQEQIRFPDPTYNTSGRLHYIPVYTPPRRNANFTHILDFGTSDPEIVINNDVRAGGAIDHIFDKVVPRTNEQAMAILGSLNAGKRWMGSQQAHAAGAARPSMSILYANIA
jgi:hypothetical protein